MTTSKLSPSAAKEMLWRQGILHWMLHPAQKDLYDSYANSNGKILVWSCSRRLGKSFALCLIAIETCIKKTNMLVKYCCPKQIDAKTIIRPIFRDIIKNCPADLAPEFKVYEKAYIFPNGSRIELSGLDSGRAESLRGGSTDLAILDEAGFTSDLEYVVDSIILPTTLTTRGKIILSSTPPRSSDHPFVKYLNAARVEGNLTTKTIYDNPLIPKEELDKIIASAKGVDSNVFRREYLCEIIIDTERAVVPEFTSSVKKEIVKSWPRPTFYDTYVAMDLGVNDFTVALFAYYDFKEDKIIVEDEFVLNGQKFNTKVLAEGIREKESKCFTDPFTGEVRVPYLRVSDTNLTVINDLNQLHGLRFLPTRKDDKNAALNNMRVAIAEQRVIINPKCEVTIRHLETATWNKNKDKYDRSSDGAHYDGVDALCYLVRNIQVSKNPYPTYQENQSNRFQYKDGQSHPLSNQFKQMFNIKRQS